MTLEVLLTLYRYNEWANRRLLQAANLLPATEFTRDLGGSLQSVHGTLLHILWVELMFMRRWRGRSATDLSAPPQLDSVATISSAWEDLEHERTAYLGQLADADVTRTISYVDSRGRSVSLALWQTLIHLANHSTYHRGQVASQLRQLGYAPPATDFIVFCGEPR